MVRLSGKSVQESDIDYTVVRFPLSMHEQWVGKKLVFRVSEARGSFQTWDSYDYDARAKRGNRSQCPLPLGRFLYLVKFTSQERRKQLSLPQKK